MENILQTVKQFLEFSDEKLEELKKKNQIWYWFLEIQQLLLLPV